MELKDSAKGMRSWLKLILKELQNFLPSSSLVMVIIPGNAGVISKFCLKFYIYK